MTKKINEKLDCHYSLFLVSSGQCHIYGQWAELRRKVQKQERDLSNECKCKSENYKSCYKLAEIYERKGGATARALAIIKIFVVSKTTICINLLVINLKRASQEVFLLEGLDASERRRALSYGKECRNQGFFRVLESGSQIYLLKEKKELAMPLIKRSCAGGVESACYYLKGDQSSFIILKWCCSFIWNLCFYYFLFVFFLVSKLLKQVNPLKRLQRKK
jgi:hypothetical protein